MPLVQTDCLLGPQPDAFIHPFCDVVVFDLSISQVQPVSIGFEYIFIPGHNGAVRRSGIDPGGHCVRVIIGDGGIVGAETASSSAVALKPGDVTAELNEAPAIETCSLRNSAGSKARWRGLLRFFVLSGSGWIVNLAAARRSPEDGHLRRELSVE